jgi:hypothetical protein
MVLPVAYDITRLATRVLNKTPNGIDRIDFAFAQHFIDPAHQDRSGLMMTLLGPRVAGHAISSPGLPAIGARMNPQITTKAIAGSSHGSAMER